MQNLQILYVCVTLTEEKPTKFETKAASFSVRNTNIYNLYRAIFSVLCNISSPNFATLLILRCYFSCGKRFCSRFWIKNFLHYGVILCCVICILKKVDTTGWEKVRETILKTLYCHSMRFLQCNKNSWSKIQVIDTLRYCYMQVVVASEGRCAHHAITPY